MEIKSNSFYTPREVKSEAKNAAISAASSAGLTLLINKGQNKPLAAKIGLLAGGVSLAVGAIHKALYIHKVNKAQKAEEAQNIAANTVMEKIKETSVGTHQG